MYESIRTYIYICIYIYIYLCVFIYKDTLQRSCLEFWAGFCVVHVDLIQFL